MIGKKWESIVFFSNDQAYIIKLVKIKIMDLYSQSRTVMELVAVTTTDKPNNLTTTVSIIS